MNLRFYISRRLSYKGRVVTAAVAVSFLVVIIAVAVSSGFRHEIRRGLSEMTADVVLSPSDMNYLDESSPLDTDQSYLPAVAAVEGVVSIEPVIARAGIVKHSDEIYGVLVKGVEGGPGTMGVEVPDSVSLAVSVPVTLAQTAGLKPGDKLLTYFVGDNVRVRQFHVAGFYEPLLRTDDRYLVYADISDMRRLNGWSDDQASMFEIYLSPDHKDEDSMLAAAESISDAMYFNASDDDDILWATSSVERYPQIFDWLNVIEFNVLFVLVLMIAVAGVNMITGLLIMLFENISTIGLLKSLGMRNLEIINVFLTRAAGTVFKGMLIGNLTAFVLCIVQSSTHLLSLDPVNYFVSYVPVHLDIVTILTADFVSFVSIMVLLVLPSLFVLKVDPSKTIKMD